MIADLHFGHRNIIEYENRPFKSVEEMDEKLIENWNSVVGKRDKVFVLGDFSFYGKDETKEILNQLRGYKVLIKGNHDGRANKWFLDCDFQEVVNYPILYKGFYLLSHEPLYINSNMPYANIFGHVHGNSAYADYSVQTCCVSVEREHMNYKPIEFEKIKELIEVCEEGKINVGGEC